MSRHLSVACLLLVVVALSCRAAPRPPGGGMVAAAPAPRAAVAVLEYHHIVPQSVLEANSFLSRDNGLVIAAEEFGRQLDFLAGQGFVTVTAAGVAAFAGGEAPLPRRSVLITFDDGLESFYQYAYPALAARGMSATVFLIAGASRADNPPYDPLVLSYLSWREVEAMAAGGRIDVQSHSYNLHGTGAEGVPVILSQPLAPLVADLSLARRVIEQHVGRPVYAFAYPYGRTAPSILRALTGSGYTAAFLGGDRPAVPGDDPLLLPRFFVYPGRALTYLLDLSTT